MNFEPPDLHHLQATQGWLERGNHQEANEELENIEARNRAHRSALQVRWKTSAKPTGRRQSANARLATENGPVLDGPIPSAPGKLNVSGQRRGTHGVESDLAHQGT
jgi:hypothetical protein